MALKIGAKAPNFTLQSTSGENFELSKNVPCIIYFYPKDFTPGCTEEACSFRDGFSELRGLNIDVYGISKDTIDSHIRFKEKLHLPFDLLSDPKGKVCRLYEALVPLINLPKRITYLIDKNQRVQAVYSDMFGARKHLETMISQLIIE